MSRLIIKTEIRSPLQRCFDLSRSIELHQVSTSHTGERAIAGKTSGLLGAGESVTWRAKHFGIWQNLTSAITEFTPYVSFTDVMVKGAFKNFIHYHRFSFHQGTTIMEDEFVYESPLGIIGKLVNKLVLDRYLTKLLVDRNNMIKQYAETDQWKNVLPELNEIKHK